MVFSTRLYHNAATSYQSTMDGIKRQINDLKNENLNYQRKLAASCEEVSQQKSTQETLRKEIEKLSIEKMANLDALNEAQTSLEKSKLENVQSCELICRLESQAEKYQGNIFELHKQIDSLEYELKHLEMNYHESTQQRKAASEKLAAVEESLKQKVEEIHNLKLQQEQDAAEHARKSQQLKQEIADVKSEKNELSLKLQTHEDKIKELDTELVSFSTKNCKLRVSKKKFKALSERLQEMNATNEKKLEDMSALTSNLKMTEDKNALLEDHVIRLKEELKERLIVTESVNEQVKHLKEHNFELDQRLRELSESHSTLTKSYGDLENEKDATEKVIKSLEDERKEAKACYERSAYKLQSAKRSIEQDLEMSRCELKERRKDVSLLKQENLEKEFQIQELTRAISENNSLLQLKEKEEQHLKDTCQRLTTEVAVLKEKQRIRDQEEQKNKQDQKDGQSLLDRIQQIKIKQEEKQKFDHQFGESKLAIAELERQLKDKESSLRAEQLEKQILNEELYRIRQTNLNGFKVGKKENAAPQFQ